MPRAIQVYTDPLQHALIAAAVAAPLGRPAVRAAVTAALVIDLDHAVAARSVRVRDTTALPTRPRTHSLVTAFAAGAAVARTRGPREGWAVFGGLVSHFLHDAGDRAAPTPMLWPFAPARQIGRRRQVVFTAALVAVSLAAGAASRRRTSAACGGSGAGTAPPRTA
ncbi:MAG TPA: metal-dependent hydrolase [Solirubrobacteraceae bacterium]|nr:metal-dependent hydrolase [Solirubrobacteraceae bacterium]